MIKIFRIILLGIAMSMASSNATAAQIILDFPSTNSILSGTCTGPLGAGGGGVCLNSGDTLTETFIATGLNSTTSTNLVFSMDNGTSPGVLNEFDVLINGSVIGDFQFLSSGAGILNFDLTFNHAEILGDDYTLQMVATTTVPNVQGSWNWIAGGTATLTAVPVPAAVWLFGSGLLGLIGLARKEKTG